MNSTHTVYKPSRHRPLKNTRCSRRNFSIGSADVKFISRDTARHFNMDFGTRASCSLSGFDLKNKHINKFESNEKDNGKTKQNSYKSVLPSQNISPLSASRRFIQFLKNFQKKKSSSMLIKWNRKKIIPYNLNPVRIFSARDGIFYN